MSQFQDDWRASMNDFGLPHRFEMPRDPTTAEELAGLQQVTGFVLCFGCSCLFIAALVRLFA